MKGPLAYVGGKSRLAKLLISLIPKHTTYCEVFMGGGWVFFGKEESKVAARYYYVQRQAYGGKARDRVYGVAPVRRPRINLLRMEEDLSEIHLRLCDVTIENLPWEELIKRYDKESTFFYLDPPYYKTYCYKYNFKSLDDFRKLNEELKGIKSKFILSINDHEDIRNVFQEFKMQQVSLNYSLGKNGNKANELIIRNF